MQTKYGYSTAKGTPGGKVDISSDKVVTRCVEANDGVLKFGMGVVSGVTTGHGVTLPTTGKKKEDFEGVVLFEQNFEQDVTGKIVIKKGATVGVMKSGKVWARTASTATPDYGKKAYLIVTGADAGLFTHEQGTNVDVGAVFGQHKDDGIAIIEF